VKDRWAELPDEKLREMAEQGDLGRAAPVEAMRRLRAAIEKLSATSDRYARWMLWLTVAVTFLTLVQAMAVIPQAMAVIPVIKAWFN
jgi:hypothetical protein